MRDWRLPQRELSALVAGMLLCTACHQTTAARVAVPDAAQPAGQGKRVPQREHSEHSPRLYVVTKAPARGALRRLRVLSDATRTVVSDGSNLGEVDSASLRWVTAYRRGLGRARITAVAGTWPDAAYLLTDQWYRWDSTARSWTRVDGFTGAPKPSAWTSWQGRRELLVYWQDFSPKVLLTEPGQLLAPSRVGFFACGSELTRLPITPRPECRDAGVLGLSAGRDGSVFLLSAAGVAHWRPGEAVGEFAAMPTSLADGDHAWLDARSESDAIVVAVTRDGQLPDQMVEVWSGILRLAHA